MAVTEHKNGYWYLPQRVHDFLFLFQGVENAVRNVKSVHQLIFSDKIRTGINLTVIGSLQTP